MAYSAEAGAIMRSFFELGHAFFAGFFRHVSWLEHPLKLRDFSLRIVFAAHFLVDGFDLLGKVVFPLVFYPSGL